MIYPIVKYGNPVLEKPAEPVTNFDEDLAKLVEDMFESMYAAHGVGLAAPQIGISRRLAVIDISFRKDAKAKLVLANPQIVKVEGKQRGDEGCLSIPDFREPVTRGQKGKHLEAPRAAKSERLEARSYKAEDPQADESRRVVGEPLNLVFAGTPPFAVPSLNSLAGAGFKISLVVTQPDRPKGRGMEVAHSPVKQRATELGLPLTQPEKIKNNLEFRSQLESIRPQAIIVVGYGRLIPQWMLDLPPLGNINVHASLLPKYRGAAPIQWAIANGEGETGVTIMKIDAWPTLARICCWKR